MVDVEQWAELRREHFVRGVAIKELVRRTGLSRNTVRAALQARGGLGRRREQPAIKSAVARTPFRPRVSKVFPKAG